MRKPEHCWNGVNYTKILFINISFHWKRAYKGLNVPLVIVAIGNVGNILICIFFSTFASSFFFFSSVFIQGALRLMTNGNFYRMLFRDTYSLESWKRKKRIKIGVVEHKKKRSTCTHKQWRKWKKNKHLHTDLYIQY